MALGVLFVAVSDNSAACHCTCALHAAVAGKVLWSGPDWLSNTVHTSRSAASRSCVHL